MKYIAYVNNDASQLVFFGTGEFIEKSRKTSTLHIYKMTYIYIAIKDGKKFLENTRPEVPYEELYMDINEDVFDEYSEAARSIIKRLWKTK